MSYLNTIYEQNKIPFTNYPTSLVNYLLKKYNVNAPGKILDIAAGRGEFINAFSQKGFDSYSLDRENMVKEYFPSSNIDHKCFDYKNKLPYDSDSFDIVFCKSFIEHLRDPQTFTTEVYRILKKNGALIMLTPDWESVYKTFYHDFTHLTPFTTQSCEDLLTITGFRDVKVEKFFQLPFLWDKKYLNFIPFLIRNLFVTKLKYKSKLVRFSKEIMILSYSIK